MLLQHAGRGLIAAFDVGSCDSIFASYVSSAVLKGGGDRFVIVLAFRLPSLQVISFFTQASNRSRQRSSVSLKRAKNEHFKVNLHCIA